MQTDPGSQSVLKDSSDELRLRLIIRNENGSGPVQTLLTRIKIDHHLPDSPNEGLAVKAAKNPVPSCGSQTGSFDD